MGNDFKIDKKSDLFLGIGGSLHDYSVCLIRDGKIQQAIESERILRVKHSINVFSPLNSSFKYISPNKKLIVNSASTSDIFGLYNLHNFKNRLTFFNHHLCHAAASFYTSPFKDSAVFVCDGLGGSEYTKKGYFYETSSYFSGSREKIDLIGKNGFYDNAENSKFNFNNDQPNSLGYFYERITNILGFGYLEEGKTMGLSAYGNPNKYYKQLKEQFVFEKNGKIEIKWSTEDLTKFYNNCKSRSLDNSTNRLNADIAASAQKILEECYFYSLNFLYKVTRLENLCLSGGVALNSVANGKITKMTPFKNIYTFPACGDSGTAVGAAYLSYYQTYPKRVYISIQSPFLGKTYNSLEILKHLKQNKLLYKKSNNIYNETAKLLINNKIIGWFQGGSEFGPRALGHRSIIVDPRKKWLKNYLNLRVKKREAFRPFAPAILFDYVDEYFEDPRFSPYMLDVFTIKKEKRKFIPAVVHADGTGRIQTVDENNEHFYKLISSFNKITGVPVILNTSLNINGMPIVESPKDAIECFLKTKIDVLVIGNYICTKPKENFFTKSIYLMDYVRSSINLLKSNI